MRNVVFCRVDDRLIHGEVVTAWIPNCKANRVFIVDDEVVKDEFNVRVVKALAPAGTKVFVFGTEKAAQKLLGKGVEGERIIILTKSPTTFNELRKLGCTFSQVNVGGAGIRGDRKPFINNVALDINEVLACEEMKKSGIDVYYQLVPEQGRVEIDKAVADAKAAAGM